MRRAPSYTESESPFDDTARPSKSALKRQMHDLQSLGKELCELSAGQLAALELPERLSDAIHEYQRTRSHEGRRRQLQFIGKLMRDVDAEPLREAVASLKLGGALDTLMLHEAERWRDALVADDQAITRWLDEYPGSVEPQALRALLRKLRKEEAAASAAPEGGERRHGKSYRDLFQLIKNTLNQAGPQDLIGDDDESPDDDE